MTFVHSQGGTGTATLTLTQSDSAGVLSTINLNVGTDDFSTAGGPGRKSDYYVGPDTGGTWTLTAATSGNVYTLGGATNDTGVMTVRAEQLTDGYNSVIGTASAGSLVAIVHDLLVQRKPSNLRSNIVA